MGEMVNTYLTVDDGIIMNIIQSDAAFAESIGAKPYYQGARVGDEYDPPTLARIMQKLTELDKTEEITDLRLALAELAAIITGGAIDG